MEQITENKVIKRLQKSTHCPLSRQEFFKIHSHGLSSGAIDLFLTMRFAAINWKDSEVLGQLKATIRDLQVFLKWKIATTYRKIKELKDQRLIQLLKPGLWLVSLDGKPLLSPAEHHRHGDLIVKDEKGIRSQNLSPVEQVLSPAEQDRHEIQELLRKDRGKEENLIKKREKKFLKNFEKKLLRWKKRRRG